MGIAKVVHRKGFTVVEVTLAMAFISVLFVTIVVITLNIISLYQKGLTIRAVNSVGQELVDEFSRSVSAASIENLDALCSLFLNNNTGINACKTEDAKKFIFQEKTNDGSAVTLENGSTVSGPLQLNGAFCTGYYSYIWNTGYASRVTNGSAAIKYKKQDGSTTTSRDFQLVRVLDTSRSVCAKRIENNYELKNVQNFTYDLTSFGAEPFKELLPTGETDLILYDFDVFNPVQDTIVTQQTFYSATFILGTRAGSINIRNNGEYCTVTPDEADFDYCAINKFNFAMRATGRSNR